MQGSPSAEGSGADYGDVWRGFHVKRKRIPVSSGGIVTEAPAEAEEGSYLE